MSLYPNEIDTFREKENLPGHPFDSANKKAFFVEDIQALESDVVAIESELGLNPKAGEADVASRLDVFDDKLDQSSFLTIAKAMGVGIKLVCVGSGYQNTSVTLTAGRLRLTMIHVPKAMTFTGLVFALLISGDYTASDYNGVVLYKLIDDELVLVASSTSDGNLFKGTAQSLIFKPFSSSYEAEPGIYYLGVLHNRSAVVTSAVIGLQASLFSSVGTSLNFPNGLAFSMFKTGQLTPSSVYSATSFGTSSQLDFYALY